MRRYPCGICGEMVESRWPVANGPTGYMIACSERHWDMMQRIEAGQAAQRRENAQFLRDIYKRMFGGES